jgi:hypothetical protein
MSTFPGWPELTMLSAPHGSSSLVPISTHPESISTHPRKNESGVVTIKKSASDGQVSHRPRSNNYPDSLGPTLSDFFLRS